MSRSLADFGRSLTPEQIATMQAKAKRRTVRDGDKLVPVVFEQINEVTVPASPQKSTDLKFGNVKVTDEAGEVVDSKKEARRRKELRLAGRGGFITELAFQVEFFLGVHKDETGHEHVCKYIADAVYVDAKGRKHVEDTKSAHTRTLPVYRLKRRLMKALLNIEIEEV